MSDNNVVVWIDLTHVINPKHAAQSKKTAAT